MKAEKRLNRAYSLVDRLLAEIRGAQVELSGLYERQPEHIGAILARVVKGMEERCQKRNGGKT